MTGPEESRSATGAVDADLVGVVVRAARAVPGVVRLQRRPRIVVPDDAAADATAVTVLRAAPGELAVTVQLVSTSEPSPRVVVAAVGRAVLQALDAVGEGRVDLEVTVADVEP